jgi:hypothetical protein
MSIVGRTGRPLTQAVLTNSARMHGRSHSRFCPFVHLRIVETATPIRTSPRRFQGELFRFFNVAISSSCFAIAASLAAIVSFFAASAILNASVSLRRVSFNSFSTASVRNAVSIRSRKATFSRSSAAVRRRVAESSSTAAAQAVMICDAVGSLARVAEFGELSAELGGCAFAFADSASTISSVTSIASIGFE